jgi:hypothetical protein
VSFASITSSVCTVSGATVTLVGVGTCTIQATQAGNTNYSAATPVNQSFLVTIGGQAAMSFGIFAQSSACPAITFSGNGSTDSYSTAGYTSANASSAYAATKAKTGGNIGTNGTVSLSGNATIGGSIGASNAKRGSCPDGLSASGNAGMFSNPANQLVQIPITTFPTPPAPSPLPPTTNVSYSGNSSTSITPGSYSNITVSGNAKLTLAPGTYNINSLTVSGNAAVTISPVGAVVFNIAGTGQNTPLSLSGNGITNPSEIPNNVRINYAGSGSITLSGDSDFYAVVDAPNATVTYSGNGNFYGSIIGNRIVDTGNGAIHYDTNASAATI